MLNIIAVTVAVILLPCCGYAFGYFKGYEQGEESERETIKKVAEAIKGDKNQNEAYYTDDGH